MYYLFKRAAGLNGTGQKKNDFLNECVVETLKPHPFRLFTPGEHQNMRIGLLRGYFWAITLGNYKIFFLKHHDKVIHSSYVIPKCIKFPFLKAGDYEIGPCNTHVDFRRKGSYQFMLGYILSCEEHKAADLFMIADEGNKASINGIEKAGFKRCGTVERTRLKNYRIGR